MLPVVIYLICKVIYRPNNYENEFEMEKKIIDMECKIDRKRRAPQQILNNARADPLRRIQKAWKNNDEKAVERILLEYKKEYEEYEEELERSLLELRKGKQK
jgi:hypothetical protein